MNQHPVTGATWLTAYRKRLDRVREYVSMGEGI
jgi:hypothetical protein